MKKQIIATAIIATLATSTSFAAVNEAEVNYLFGAEAVEVQSISSVEMAQTEGQLFGITSELIGKYLGVAAVALRPVLKGLSKSLGEGIADGITSSISNTATFRDPEGNTTAAKIGEGFLDGVQASLGSTFSLSNLIPGFSLLNLFK